MPINVKYVSVVASKVKKIAFVANVVASKVKEIAFVAIAHRVTHL